MRKTKAHPRRKRKCCGGDKTPLRDDDGQSELGISRRAAGCGVEQAKAREERATVDRKEREERERESSKGRRAGRQFTRAR